MLWHWKDGRRRRRRKKNPLWDWEWQQKYFSTWPSLQHSVTSVLSLCCAENVPLLSWRVLEEMKAWDHKWHFPRKQTKLKHWWIFTGPVVTPTCLWSVTHNNPQELDYSVERHILEQVGTGQLPLVFVDVLGNAGICTVCAQECITQGKELGSLRCCLMCFIWGRSCLVWVKG